MTRIRCIRRKKRPVSSISKIKIEIFPLFENLKLIKYQTSSPLPFLPSEQNKLDELSRNRLFQEVFPP
ncbi:hypothetical protein AYO37_00650 [Opitutia bacterium SCGC AG-212-L18]|nr:hypothetical protein AYO37_00650 [Opitutae bacterium SCGC AG-212-L18]